ncbi:MAG: hypothetical protein EOP87_25230 [Verrucomicrobiaceae bacterium]|nr:MAG: hypothetical protein EOP87_25230 [Verrucomicrobiaceae bacterium]
MKPRPVYRWKTFWLGIFILTYLGWAWATSPGTMTTTAITIPGRWLAVTQLDSQVGFFHGKSSTLSSFTPGTPSATPEWDFAFERRPSRSTIDHVYWESALRRYSRGFIITHWLLILLFLALWIPILALRWMRLNRLSASAPAPDGGQIHPEP